MKTHHTCQKLKKTINKEFCTKLCRLHLKEGCSLKVNTDYPIEETYFTIEVVDVGGCEGDDDT